MKDVTMPQNGAHHLGSLPRADRRDAGKVYTPDALADFVTDQAVVDANETEWVFATSVILDPACGAGVFLAASAKRIAAGFEADGHEIQGHGATAFLTHLQHHLWGLDIDPVAVDLARSELARAASALTGTKVDADRFKHNVLVGDFLRPLPGALADLRPHFIVGNPPYVSAQRISAADKAYYKSNFSTAFGRLDLYTLFFERSAALIEPGGTLAFITPDKFLATQSAKPLRQLLAATGTVRSFAVFTSHRIFNDAATVPCVTVWTAGPPQATSTDSPHGLKGHSTLPDMSGNFRFRRLRLDNNVPAVVEQHEFPVTYLNRSQWRFEGSADGSLELRLQGQHPTLQEVTGRISAGLTTGYNPAFILDRRTAAALEPELLHPTVRGRDVQANKINFHDTYMLVPYTWDTDGRPQLINLVDYPKTRRWLTRHQHALKNRHCVRIWDKNWWDLHDPVGAPLHTLAKVLVPDLARSNRFAADEGQYVPQHSVYYMTSTHVPPDVLAAVLNSSPIEYLIRAAAPVAKDGFSRYRRQFLQNLPIPATDADTHQQIRAAVAEQRHDDLAGITAALFGVDQDEVTAALRALPVANPGPGHTRS